MSSRVQAPVSKQKSYTIPIMKIRLKGAEQANNRVMKRLETNRTLTIDFGQRLQPEN